MPDLHICPLLGLYAPYSGSFLPMFRDHISAPYSGGQAVKELMNVYDGTDGLSETSEINHHSKLRKIPENADLIHMAAKDGSSWQASCAAPPSLW